jgi:hypothetical protein
MHLKHSLHWARPATLTVSDLINEHFVPNKELLKFFAHFGELLKLILVL